MPDQSESKPPDVVQGIDAPAFRGTPPNGLTFDCDCGNTLIEHYYSDCFIAVAIQCFKCKAVTRTPSLPDGEILPNTVMNLADLELNRPAMLKGTVEFSHRIALTNDSELIKAQAQLAPREPNGDFELTDEGLAKLEAAFDDVTNGKLAVQLAAARRHAPVQAALEFPFAWATLHIKACFEEKLISVARPLDMIAIRRLYLFHHALSAWSHHPRFADVAREFEMSFEHTSMVLIAAFILHQAGNRVGFTPPSTGPNPDLYARLGAVPIFLEVKMPTALRWSQDWALSREGARAGMKAALESSRRQINRTRKGILIVGSSANDTRLARVLEEEATHSISKKGRDRTGINAIMTMAPTFDLVPANTGTSVQFEVTPAFALNPHFNSEGFVRTTE